MIKIKYLCTLLINTCACIAVNAQTAPEKPEDTEVWLPVPKKVMPANVNIPPSDAVVLFDGKNLDSWETWNGGKANWTIVNNELIEDKGDIHTKQKFSDFQLHIEWKIPADITGEGQDRGNSGIFLQDRYELQILDSYSNKTYVNGMAGSIYKQSVPLVNASLPVGQWQSYDVVYTAPKFSSTGALLSPAKITLLHNGILTLYNFEIMGDSKYTGKPAYKAHGAMPIRLQDHHNHVAFRNIWIRPL